MENNVSQFISINFYEGKLNCLEKIKTSYENNPIFDIFNYQYIIILILIKKIKKKIMKNINI